MSNVISHTKAGVRSEEELRSRWTQNPLRLLVRALVLFASKQITFMFKEDGSGMVDKGEHFKAFRKMSIVDMKKVSKGPNVILKIRFQFKNLSFAANKRLSLLPIPLIAAQPGFISKTWHIGEQSGDFIGRYEFASREAAHAYMKSLPVRMMRRRAVSETLRYEISVPSENYSKLNN